MIMLVVGLTGGIASGKSEVSALFEQTGAEVIDTDLISRELVEPGRPLLETICNEFGREILNPDGSLNRQQLRDIIFEDDKARNRLEEILHPAIRETVRKRIATSSAPYAIVVIPLLAETRYPYELDRILVVDTLRENQVSRLMKRDKISEEAALKILDTQATREQRLAIADDIILNDGDKSHLSDKVQALNDQYLGQCTDPPHS